jgi:hypothetical protein
MGTIVSGLRPGFRLAKLEGDAAFTFAVTEKVDGSLLPTPNRDQNVRARGRLRALRALTWRLERSSIRHTYPTRSPNDTAPDLRFRRSGATFL